MKFSEIVIGDPVVFVGDSIEDRETQARSYVKIFSTKIATEDGKESVIFDHEEINPDRICKNPSTMTENYVPGTGRKEWYSRKINLDDNPELMKILEDELLKLGGINNE